MSLYSYVLITLVLWASLLKCLNVCQYVVYSCCVWLAGWYFLLNLLMGVINLWSVGYCNHLHLCLHMSVCLGTIFCNNRHQTLPHCVCTPGVEIIKFLDAYKSVAWDIVQSSRIRIFLGSRYSETQPRYLGQSPLSTPSM